MEEEELLEELVRVLEVANSKKNILDNTDKVEADREYATK